MRLTFPSLSFLLLFIFSASFAVAQTGVQGSVAGKLQDASTKQPVGYATASLLSGPDSTIVASALVGGDGAFAIGPVGVGRYHLKISFVGYATRVVPNIQVTAAEPNVNVGIVGLRAGSTQLEAVEVVGQRAQVEYALDRRVYNVSKDLSTVGGTAVDVMQNVPSVTVDQEGTVSMRGTSNITILIDGKPSALSGLGLEQIPASTIERVEVITNPSSKYDPSGTGGVLNIILKKEKQRGLNGMASVNAGLGDRYNTSLNLNYRFGKLNLFSNYDFRQDKRIGTGNQFRTNFGTEGTPFLEQESNNLRTNSNHNIRFGADYQLTEFQSLTGSVLYRMGSNESESTRLYRYLGSERGLDSTSSRKTLGFEDRRLWEYALSYRKTFGEAGREFTADAVFNVEQEPGEDQFSQQFYNPDGSISMLTPSVFQRNYGLEQEKEFSLQADYINPIGEKGKWEAGYRSRFEREDSDNDAFDLIDGQYRNSLARTNHFVYDEWVHAVYGNYGNAYNKWSYQVGARLEQTYIITNQITQEKRNKRDYLNVFPTAFVTYEFSEEQKIQTSYSRRIDRPGTRQLNPFLDISDPYNQRSGNPNLDPEFINSYEVNYLRFWDHTTATATVFYRKMTDVVQQFREQRMDPDYGLISYSTFQNFADGTSYGLELTGSTNPTAWLRINANASGFNYRINSRSQGIANSSRVSWTGRMNSNFTLPYKTEVQLSLYYRSPTVQVQGERSGMFTTSLSARKEVLKGKGNVILRVQDLFNTMRFNSFSYSDVMIDGDISVRNFEETSRYKPQSQIVYVGFSYRFGGDNGKKSPKNDRGNEGGFQGDSEGGGDF